MRHQRLAGPGSLALLLAALCAAATPAQPDYHARREALAKAFTKGVIVLFGRQETTDDLNRFFQEPDFYYLTGWTHPGAILLVDPRRQILFLPQHNSNLEKLFGPQSGPDDPTVPERTGARSVMPVERFETELRASLEQWPTIYTVGDDARTRLKAFAPLREVGGAEQELARLRMKKDAAEIALLQNAADAAIAAHLAAWKQAAPNRYEYEIAAVLQGAYFMRGCERNAYPPIVGSGPNSIYLHYQRNDRRMDRGDLLLMDAGGECAGYTADITRTIPVGGKFTPRQREIYDIVLAAQKAAIAAVKPGATFGRNTPDSIFKVAYDYINSHGKDLHGESLGKYFTHGISHHIGLEVHDAANNNAPLEEGMVISVEPGIYIPEENIGIRIEDMVLVTKDGAKVLTSALPREPADIEKALQ